MKDHQLEQLKEHIAEIVQKSVKETVNGQIKKVENKLDDYVTKDEAWKVRAEPVVVAFENSKWSLKVIVAVVKFLALLSPAIAGWLLLKDFIKK